MTSTAAHGPLASAPASDGPIIPGAPVADLRRSPVAASIAALAADSGLLMAHFEHRIHLPMPLHWVPEGREDLGRQIGWQAGVLPESKYTTFRHDMLVGSFHPMHRGKWTVHELTHGLVGFAWRPDAPPFFHALAARLAEVLPVAFWYFHDEARLRRCPDHAGQGPLYNDFCRACERAAERGPVDEDPQAERWIAEGRAFVERELAAVLKSRRLGRPVSHRLATLELSSDGLAYAGAQSLRLGSEEFGRFVELFFAEEGFGRHRSLDDLEARVIELLDHVEKGTPARPLATSRWDLIAQDVGWRLLTVRAELLASLQPELDALVERLAEDPTPETVAEVVDAYRELHAAIELPDPNDLFAVGYELPNGYGRSVRQMIDGVASACPATMELLGWRHAEVITEFVARDVPERKPLGRRFAAFLRDSEPDNLHELAEFEAAVAHAEPVELAAITCAQGGARGERVRIADGFELVHAGYDVVELAQSLQAGQPTVPPERPTHLAVARLPAGDLFIADLTPEAARALEQLQAGPLPRTELELPPGEIETLEELGIVVPEAWDADA